MFKKISYIWGVFSLLMVNFAFSQENSWQREYDAMVNGKLMTNAYSGGDATIQWPKPVFVDIDNDGDLDLFIGKGGKYESASGKVSFYRNDGEQTSPDWTLVTDYYNSIDVGQNAAPTFCDIDADGDFDLFIGNGYEGCHGGNVIFYCNEGTPDSAVWFWVTDSLALIDVCDNSVPTFADIDADGDFDLFVGGGYGKIAFCRNIGTPQSAQWDSVIYPYHSIDVGWKSTPTLVDIDMDGDFDLFIGYDRGKLYFYRNDGTPQNPMWTPVTTSYAGVDFGWLDYTAPAFSDIDGDDDFDLFVSEHYGNVNFYRNVGTPDSAAWFWETGDYISGTIDVGKYSAPTFADIDDDGDFDMFIGKVNGHIRFYGNVGDSLTPHWVLETEAYNEINVNSIQYQYDLSTPTFADIDADDDLDLFVGVVDGYIEFYRNDGFPDDPDWCFVTDEYESIDVGSRSAPTFVDIDGDNDFDLFVGNGAGTIYQYLNIGTPDSAVWSLITEMYDSIDALGSSKPVFVDIDTDGDFDLFIGRYSGMLSFYQNDGDSLSADFTFVTDYYNSIDVGDHSTPNFVDIDADGDVDLFVGEADGGVNFWRSVIDYGFVRGDAQADGNHDLFDGLRIIYWLGGAVAAPPCISAADTDDDGDTDLFDGLRIIYWLGGVADAPPSPCCDFPPRDPNDCGPDPTPDGLTCLSYPPCGTKGEVAIKIALVGFADKSRLTLHRLATGGVSVTLTNAEPLVAFSFVVKYDAELTTAKEVEGLEGFDIFVANVDEPGLVKVVAVSDIDIADGVTKLPAGEHQVARILFEGRHDASLEVANSVMAINHNQALSHQVVVKYTPELPTEFHLAQNYPNPFNPMTEIKYALPVDCQVKLEVYNLLGQKVATLVDEKQAAGYKTIRWDSRSQTGNEVSSGLYFYRLQAGDFVETRKMALIR